MALGTAFLSAVASGFGLWGARSSHWAGFLAYAGEVNWFLPAAVIPAVGVAATVFELTFGLLLVVGWQVRIASYGSAGIVDDVRAGDGIGQSEITVRLVGFHCINGSTAFGVKHEKGRREMTERLKFKQHAPKAYKALLDVGRAVSESGLEEPLLHMVYLRVSQINGCAFCNDMHWKDARRVGEPEEKLARVVCWAESPGFTDRERAAFAWAEAVTNLHEGHVPDAAFEAVRAHFSEVELSHLTIAIASINSWNRLAISFRMVPGGA